MPQLVLSHAVDYTRRPLTSFGSAEEMYAFASRHSLSYRAAEVKDNWGSITAASEREVTEHFFLREYVWCVYVAGFKAETIHKKIDTLLRLHRIEDGNGKFLPRTSPGSVTGACDEEFLIHAEVVAFFGNSKKADAVQDVRRMIAVTGWEKFSAVHLRGRDPARLRGLPFMGPALSRQLARSLGNRDVVKPDVHMKRLAYKYGYGSDIEAPQRMCEKVSPDWAGHTDLLIWYAAIDHGTEGATA